MPRFLIAVPLLGLLTWTLGCASLGARPTIEDVRFRVAGIDFQGIDLAFDVDVKNPYPVSLGTPRFRYGLDIEDAEFLKSSSTAQVELPAGRTSTARLPVRVEYAALWGAFSRLSGARQAGFRLHGALLVSALGREYELPIERRGTLPILRLPTLTVRDIDFSDISLSGARVSIETELGNPNAFDIGCHGLGYAIRLGDIDIGGIGASTIGTVPATQTGRLVLTGEITAGSALFQLVRGEGLGTPDLTPTGSLTTPYGTVELPR